MLILHSKRTFHWARVNIYSQACKSTSVGVRPASLTFNSDTTVLDGNCKSRMFFQNKQKLSVIKSVKKINTESETDENYFHVKRFMISEQCCE